MSKLEINLEIIRSYHNCDKCFNKLRTVYKNKGFIVGDIIKDCNCDWVQYLPKNINDFENIEYEWFK